MKKINLCLTFSGTTYAKLIRWFTKDKYSHVSLALDGDKTRWYSMGRKGKNRFWIVRFQVEDVRLRFTEWFPNTELMILEREVSDETYSKIEKIIEEYKKEEEKYKYNYLGILGIVFNRGIEHDNRYFCSQLIADILNEVEILNLVKPAVLTKPMDFIEDGEFIKIYEGDVHGYLSNVQA